MRFRLKEIISDSGMSLRHLSEKSGVPVNKWKSVLHSGTRVNEDLINAVADIWPQYVFWLVTGKTCPECGQISPQMERERLAERALDRDARKRQRK